MSLTVPNYILKAADNAVKHYRLAKKQIDIIEQWLESKGIDTNEMRDTDTILPHLDYGDSVDFQKELDEYLANSRLW